MRSLKLLLNKNRCITPPLMQVMPREPFDSLGISILDYLVKTRCAHLTVGTSCLVGWLTHPKNYAATDLTCCRIHFSVPKGS